MCWRFVSAFIRSQKQGIKEAGILLIMNALLKPLATKRASQKSPEYKTVCCGKAEICVTLPAIFSIKGRITRRWGCERQRFLHRDQRTGAPPHIHTITHISRRRVLCGERELIDSCRICCRRRLLLRTPREENRRWILMARRVHRNGKQSSNLTDISSDRPRSLPQTSPGETI